MSSEKPPRLVPLPFTTFRELEAADYEILVYCPSCYRWKYPELEGRHDRCFAGARFRCRECVARQRSGLGHLSIRSPLRYLATDPPAYEIADIGCGGRICHPGWEICDIDPRVAPWLLAEGQHFICPGCRRPLKLGHWHRLPSKTASAGFASHLLKPRG
jgi:hypothetical protein